jgi:hypothetical protein
MARQLNSYGEEAPLARPITLARINLPDVDIELEAKEAAERITTARTIRQGLDAWRAIGKSNSFEAWLAIGGALCIGKARALRAANTNKAWGSAYSRHFGRWMSDHGFGAMRKMTRSWAIALYENAPAIEQWRSELPERERRRLRDPQSVVRKWRQSCMARGDGHRCPADLKRYALIAFRRFVTYVAALPQADQIQMWATVRAAADAAQ